MDFARWSVIVGLLLIGMAQLVSGRRSAAAQKFKNESID
jgi:hypothetical protein